MRTTFAPADGPVRLIFAFEAVVIGGLGSLWGTLVGGIILGVSQAIGNQISPSYQILAGHLVFLAVLIFRPEGLFSRPGTPDMTTAASRCPAFRVERATRERPRGGCSSALGRGRRRWPACRLGAAPAQMKLLVEFFTLLAMAADVEPPGGLRRARLDRPAGLHRPRRVRAVRRRRRPRPPAASWRSSAPPRSSAALVALVTSALRLPAAGRLLRHRHVGHRRGHPDPGRRTAKELGAGTGVTIRSLVGHARRPTAWR